ncbi:unnamed protein product [Closterium sp. NIES-65]|nr:unnamed protein product [Closterium sp. NIES-65]
MLRRFRFGRLGSLPIQPHAALSRLFQLRNAPLTSLRALPREPPRACPSDAPPRHFTVVAGRRNHGGGAMKQRPKDWRPQSTPFHARNRSPRRNDRTVPLGPRGGNGGDGGDGSAESAGRMQRDVADLGADWRLGPGEAVGRVMSAQANFVRVIVTRYGVEGEREGIEAGEERRHEAQRSSKWGSRGGQRETPRGTAEQQVGEQRQQAEGAEGREGKEGMERREGREEEREGVELLCVVRALLKKLRRRVLVGDVVRLGGIDWAARQAVVQDVALPRASEILDPPVANADHLLLLFSLAQPPPEPSNVSRFLVAAEATGVAVSLVFNKADLVDEQCRRAAAGGSVGLLDAVREWQKRAAEWGYLMLTCSVERRIGIRHLAGPGGLLAGRTTVIAGPSGVGKSSLINAVLGEAYNRDAYKGEVCDADGLKEGGEGEGGEAKFEELRVGEIRSRLAASPTPCAFADCRHISEPGCAVDSGWERYRHYVMLMDEIRAREAAEIRAVGTKREGDVASSPQVSVSCQVPTSAPVAASCSCRSLAHPTVLWHHRMGHPSLPRLRAMSSQRLVLGLPRVLPSLPPSLAPPCGPCVEGRLRAAPHSSSLRPATEPFETLHLDVWGPAPRLGPERERYFLVVVDDFSRYTTVFPLAKKSEVTSTLIRWLLTTEDTRGRRVSCLHSDRGGEFRSGILAGFCREQGIRQSWTLPESPQQNGVAERRIGLVMEIARTSLTHACAPHFLWPYAVRYAAHQLNLWPRVSRPEVSPTSLWTGSPGVASRFRVWGCLALVRDTSADKLSPRAVPCVFLGFPEDSSDFTFYHPPSHRFFDSRDVRFEESTPYYVTYPSRGYSSSFGSLSGTASLPTVLLAACRRC